MDDGGRPAQKRHLPSQLYIGSYIVHSYLDYFSETKNIIKTITLKTKKNTATTAHLTACFKQKIRSFAFDDCVNTSSSNCLLLTCSIINVLVSPFRFIWIPMLWAYCHYNMFTLTVRGSTLVVRNTEFDVYRRQIMSTKVYPRTVSTRFCLCTRMGRREIWDRDHGVVWTSWKQRSHKHQHPDCLCYPDYLVDLRDWNKSE